VRRLLPLLAIVYPFALILGLRWVEPRGMALALGLLLVLRAPAASLSTLLSWHSIVPALVLVAVLGASWVWNDERVLLLTPVSMNVALLIAFGSTLLGGPTFVERIARSRTPDLPAAEVAYCRAVTKVWCAFFVANGSCCAFLALLGDRWLWATYTGFVSYLLMGIVFAVEFTIRSSRFGRYAGSPLEPLLRRAFGPPRA
jgi:uncharacterized membrane protein